MTTAVTAIHLEHCASSITDTVRQLVCEMVKDHADVLSALSWGIVRNGHALRAVPQVATAKYQLWRLNAELESAWQNLSEPELGETADQLSGSAAIVAEHLRGIDPATLVLVDRCLRRSLLTLTDDINAVTMRLQQEAVRRRHLIRTTSPTMPAALYREVLMAQVMLQPMPHDPWLIVPIRTMDSEAPPASEPELPPFYAPLEPDLCQGDIVFSVPVAVFEHPLTICRPDGPPNVKPRAHFAAVGVAERPPAYAKGRTETLHAFSGRPPGFGMVVWEDCQIEKMRNIGYERAPWFVGVAPLFSLVATFEQADDRAHVLEGRRPALFPVVAFPTVGIDEDYFADFRYIIPIRYDMVSSTRKAALSPHMRVALQIHYFRFLTAKMWLRTSRVRVAGRSCRGSAW